MFRALKMEKTIMAILLSLIIAMGAFNLVSSQVMLVTDKQADIAIIAATALAMAFFATIYPAWRASRTPPAEALRYE
jgi:lipoprotein-releasing system permease protein